MDMKKEKEIAAKNVKSFSEEITEMLNEVRGGASTYTNGNRVADTSNLSQKQQNFYGRYYTTNS